MTDKEWVLRGVGESSHTNSQAEWRVVLSGRPIVCRWASENLIFKTFINFKPVDTFKNGSVCERISGPWRQHKLDSSESVGANVFEILEDRNAINSRVWSEQCKLRDYWLFDYQGKNTSIPFWLHACVLERPRLRFGGLLNVHAIEWIDVEWRPGANTGDCRIYRPPRFTTRAVGGHIYGRPAFTGYSSRARCASWALNIYTYNELYLQRIICLTKQLNFLDY